MTNTGGNLQVRGSSAILKTSLSFRPFRKKLSALSRQLITKSRATSPPGPADLSPRTPSPTGEGEQNRGYLNGFSRSPRIPKWVRDFLCEPVRDWFPACLRFPLYVSTRRARSAAAICQDGIFRMMICHYGIYRHVSYACYIAQVV